MCCKISFATSFFDLTSKGNESYKIAEKNNIKNIDINSAIIDKKDVL